MDGNRTNSGPQGLVDFWRGPGFHPDCRCDSGWVRKDTADTIESLRAEVERLSQHRCQHCGRTWERDSNIYDECGDCYREHQRFKRWHS